VSRYDGPVGSQRFLLVYQAQRILLPEGETLIGRGLACRVRFNDPAVSRQHLRILVQGSRAVAVNLGSNGTLIRGSRLTRARELSAGDELRLGHQRIRVEVVEETDPGPRPVALVAREDLEETAPGDLPGEVVPPPLPELDAIALGPRTIDAIEVHTCPRCRAQVSYFDDTCPRCAYVWPPGHPSHHTQKILIGQVPQRRDPRYAMEVPVIYSSESLTVDAIVRDLSRGGMFVATELLDPIGTTCEITALPDGHGALRFTGLVVHVSDDRSSARGAGIGVKFAGGSPEALAWLEQTLARFEGQAE
jgi:Tfp pilus assembly protein PilZ